MSSNPNRAQSIAPGFTLRAKKSFRLGGRPLAEGSVFGVNEREARALIAVGFAEQVTDEVIPKPEPGTLPEIPMLLKSLGGCPSGADGVEGEDGRGPPLRQMNRKRGPDKKPRKKRTYKRRDMVAEE